MSSPPNLDKANDGDFAGVMTDVLQNFLRGVDDMIPAKVVSYDDATNRAVIKPLVMLGTTDGQKISRAQLSNIPVFRFGGGGFFIRFPVKAGDFGWLKATDRDMSLIMQRGGLEDWPNTLRQHSFSDGMFFPDTLKSWAIDGANADALVIQSLDGSVCVSLHSGKVRIEATDIEMVGSVQVTGNVAVTGTMTNNGVNIGSTHVHSGVDAGPSNTGGPL
jgi:hypothetical protein